MDSTSSDSSDGEENTAVVSSDILKKLQQYGDSLLDEDDYQKRRKKIKKKKQGLKQNSQNITEKKVPISQKNTTNPQDNSPLKKKKVSKLKGQAKHLHRLKEELGLYKNKVAANPNPEKSEQSNGRAGSTNSEKGTHTAQKKMPEVVVFDDPAKRKMKKKIQNQNGGQIKKSLVESGTKSKPAKKNKETEPDFNLRQAKNDVLKFGIKGMVKEKREEVKIAQAIKLGAKPAKNKYMNYKQLIEMKKKAAEEEEEARELSKNMGFPVSSQKNVKKRKREREDVVPGYLDGQIGKYKKGVQKVSKLDIQETEQKGKKRRR